LDQNTEIDSSIIAQGADFPRWTLYEADSSSWQLDAIDNIKAHLKKKLPKEIAVIA